MIVPLEPAIVNSSNLCSRASVSASFTYWYVSAPGAPMRDTASDAAIEATRALISVPRRSNSRRKSFTAAAARSDSRCSKVCVTRAEISAAGIQNYSIYLYGTQTIGFYEVDDPEAARAYLSKSEVNARWQDAMAELLEERVTGGGPEVLPEVFRLD